MKKLYMAVAITMFFCIAGKISTIAQTPSDVFISEYVEGSSNNKALEFYNGTGASIDLSAGNYVVQFFFNGSASAGTTISLTGTVANGAVYVLANASASFASESYVNQTSSASWFNGDDAIELKKGGSTGTIIDAIGQVGVDPGTEWGTGLTSTADNTLRRKASVCTGDTNPSDVFDPSIEWDGDATDDLSGLGTHTTTCAISAPITLNPTNLNFTTTVGVASAEQSYTIQGNALTDDVIVTAPANFEISSVAGGPYTSSITVSAADANASPVPVYVIYNSAVQGTQTGNITNISGSYSASEAVQGTANSNAVTPVYTIQGSGDASPLVGTVVNTEGIVTATFQGSTQLGGFYIQDTTGDGDTSTSDGIFIFNSSFPVSVGDYVQLTGTVTEYFNLTEINNVTAVTVLSSGNALMQPVNISLPVTSSDDFEKYEGMLVKFPQTLTVSETYSLARYGELSLSSGGRLFTPTNFVDPNDDPPSGTNSDGTSNVAAVTAQQAANNNRLIILNDGSNVQNPPVVPFLNPADTTLRCGTTVDGLTGIMDYNFGAYQIEPSQAPVFNYDQRPPVPGIGNSNIKVSSFNVLNFFNGDGMGGGFPTARGANTYEEFIRQKSKIVSAIKSLNADVVGLTEIENDGDDQYSAIADLVNTLNDSTSAGTYAFIPDPTGANGNSGTDAIKVAIIYKPASVTPVGASRADVNPVHNRPPLAQTFSLNNDGEKFNFIINHFKSKGCSDATGADVDQNDGQSCYNYTRKEQANDLLLFIDSIKTSSGDSDVIAVGDFNAYDEEDPIDILRAGGLTDLLPGSYSYVFDAQSGSIDHGFASSSLISNITGASEWHINAGEPVAKDYNQEFNQPYLYSHGPYRSSDHDPVLVGMNLQPCKADTSITSVTVCSGNLPYHWNGNEYTQAGTYYFDTTNSSGCDSVATLILQVNNGVIISSVTSGSISCFGGTTYLTVNASGGAKPYLYSLNGSRGRRTNTTSNIKAGTDSIMVIDANGCTATAIYTTTQPTKVKGRISVTRPSCKGGADGSITLQANGGVGNYEYSLNHGAYTTNNTFTGLSAGTYIVSAKDGNGCSVTSSVNMPDGKGKCSSIIAQSGSANNAAINSGRLLVTVLPNPSANYFTVTINSVDNSNVYLFVTDLAGRKLYSASGNKNSGYKFGENFTAGVYILTVMQGDQRQVVKVIKSN